MEEIDTRKFKVHTAYRNKNYYCMWIYLGLLSKKLQAIVTYLVIPESEIITCNDFWKKNIVEIVF